MIKIIINIISIVVSLLLSVQIVFNVVLARKENNSCYLKNARIQLIVLVLLYVIYGIGRNII